MLGIITTIFTQKNHLMNYQILNAFGNLDKVGTPLTASDMAARM